MEHGRVGFKERDVGDLLTLYGVTDSEERAALLNLAREANTPGWWHAYSDILPPGWSPTWAWRRRRRSSGPTRSSSCRGYCRPKATPAPDPPGCRELRGEIARRSELRASRQEILRRPDAPQLWVVVDEGALRRPVGSREIVREQLKYLTEMADHPAVTLQILSFSAGAHSAMGGPFTILRFAEPDLQDVSTSSS
jgi:hypothetical protein